MIPLSDDGLPEGWPRDHGIRSLGPCVLAWAEEYLAQPDGPDTGKPWRWTAPQERFVLWWYAVDDRGRFLYRRGQAVQPKGSGKTPLAAALACCELAAEVVFDGFDASGDAVGRPHPSPHVQLAAVSQDQGFNTMSLVIGMLREGLAASTIPGLDLGVTRVRTRNGALEPVTASAPSREGARATAVILDETHLWTRTNGGTLLAASLRRNLGKTDGRSLETTNTWRPGEDSVAEGTAAYGEEIAEGTATDVGLLRWHPRATVADLGDEEELRAALGRLYEYSPWVSIDRIVSEIYDLNTHPADARRYYLNEVTVADDSLIAPHEWDACLSDDRLRDGDTVVLGFDGGRTDDATALVAVRVEDRLIQPVAIWERPEGPAARGWEIDRDAVNGAVEWAFEAWRVVGFFADRALWESYIDQWARKYRDRLLVRATSNEPIAFDMRAGAASAVTRGNERLVAAVADGLIKQTGDPVLRRHVLNARRRPNRFGVSFGKDRRGSSRKVDGWAAALLADMCRHEVEASGKLDEPPKRKRSGRVYGFS